MACSKNQSRQRHSAFVNLKVSGIAAAVCFWFLVICTSAFAADRSLPLQKQVLEHPDTGKVEVSVPQGYRLRIVNSDLRRPRMIEFAPNGDMFVGSALAVYRLKPPYEKASEYIYLDNYPHSIAIRDRELFIATTTALFRVAYNPKNSRIFFNQLELAAKLPGGFGHSSRTVRVGPDDRIYVSIGISGNCSDEMISEQYSFSDRRGGVLVLDESGTSPRLVPFASGLRNPVGFDWHPLTETMYASNNGPDHWGFDNPPEYFSMLTAGSFHGMPWYQFDGDNVVRDPCIDSAPPYPADDVQLPSATFAPRSAPLGIEFVPPQAMDGRFQNNAVVAIHGSWGTAPEGLFTGDQATRRPPAVKMVQFHNGEAIGVVPIVEGFQFENGDRWARPAGVGIGPDGTLYITSDGGHLHGLMRLERTDE